MPNHFHAILEIVVPISTVVSLSSITTVGSTLVVDPTVVDPTTGIFPNDMGVPNQQGQPQGIAPTVGDIIGAFKSMTTVEYIRGIKKWNWPSFNRKLWQRNYYEHIIRNEQSFLNITQYIINNPIKWQQNKFFNIEKGRLKQHRK